MTEERIWEGVKYDGVRGVFCDRLPREGRDKKDKAKRERIFPKLSSLVLNFQT